MSNISQDKPTLQPSSSQGKAVRRKYETSAKGKSTSSSYGKSDAGKASKAKYARSDKGRASHAPAQAKYVASENGSRVIDDYEQSQARKVSLPLIADSVDWTCD